MHTLSLVAVVAMVTCWVAFVLTWLVAAIFYESRAPADQKSSWYSSLQIGAVIVVIIGVAVPAHDSRLLNTHVTWLRLAGLAVLLAASAHGLGQTRPRRHVERRARSQGRSSAAH